jgi:nucleotide-binding universal stress UspA family protein
VLDGDPREQLMELLDQERVDLLVIGSRGRGSLARLMLGSVSSHAVGHAPCSVLVVKEDRR